MMTSIREVAHKSSLSESKLGEILQARGIIGQDELDEALSIQADRGGRLGDILLAQRSVHEQQLVEALGEQLHLPVLNKIDLHQVSDELTTKIPINFAKQYKLIPLKVDDDGFTSVATSEPLSLAALDDLSLILQTGIKLYLVSSEEIMSAINHVYDRGTAHAAAAMEEMSDDEMNVFAQEIEEAVDLLDAEDEAPIIRLVNSLISQAVKENSSDIHIEPGEKEIVVRFRIDGVLYEKIRPPKKLLASIVSRIKIQAGLNIAEKRLPQDGRIRLKIAGRDIDIRVATAPTSYGERITMRLLDRSSVLLDLSDLGFSPDNHQSINTLIRKSHGIILVTGPTGSGKTTSLYACLSSINRSDLNILTIEDPVEYQLEGINQVQVHDSIGLSFGSSLRSILRQDPDILLIGEIRDEETADIAVKFSLTGHLVFSTVHANDAASTITRSN
jgi:general secretion pathway protein E